jgi:acetyl esterase
VMTTADVLWFMGLYLTNDAERSDPRFAPSMAADLSGLPPAFILSAEHDPLRDDAENYAKLLEAAGVDVVMKRYPGVFHGFFGMGGVIPQADEAMQDAVELLQKYLA